MEKRLIFLTFLTIFFISSALSLTSFAAPAYALSAGSAATQPKTVKSLYVDPANMKVSFDFQNASVADVIRMIAKIKNMNVLIGSDVKGTVTMKMHDVPLNDVLSIIMEAYGLGMVKIHGIYYINASGTIASVVSAEEKTNAISQPKITRIVPVNYVSATGLMSKIKSVLSSEGKVMYDKSLHSLLIRDIPNKVAEAIRLIKMLDRRTPEVEIVAKMVEVSRSYSSQLGISWNGGYSIAAPASNIANPNYLAGQLAPSVLGTPSFISPTAAAPSISSASPGTFSIGIVNRYASIMATLQALESLSKAKSIASPKVIVLNNQSATIEKGETLYLPGVAGVGATAAPQAITAQISLQITPHIMHNGNVKLVINSSNNTVAPPVPGSQATLDTETANSTVIIKDGQTVVLGGVYQMSKIVANGGIPGLMNIPLLGWLFKTRNVSYSNDELLIFITPKIIKN